MGKLIIATGLAVVAGVFGALTGHADAAPSPDLPRPVSTVRATWTPQVAVKYADGNNHEVWDYETLSDGIIVACGKFVQAKPRTATSWSTVGGMIAFHTTGPSRGQLTSFKPSVKYVNSSGTVGEGTVNKCEMAYDGTSLIIAGTFNRVNNVPVSNVAKISITDGRVEAFPASTNGKVTDVVKANGKYWLFGRFSKVNNLPSVGIATLNPDGTYSSYYRSKITGQISPTAGSTGAYRGVFTEDEKIMVAIVNSSSIDGQSRRHLAAWDLGATNATLRDWQLARTLTSNNTTCQNFMVGRGLSLVPGTADVVLNSTGGYRNGICDQTMRFAINVTGPAVPHKWTNRTCADTSHAAAATTGATYSQGHMKCTEGVVGGTGDWVPREGILALTTATGNLMMDWKSDQSACVGGKSLYVLNKPDYPQGLMSGSDCDAGIIFRPLE